MPDPAPPPTSDRAARAVTPRDETPATAVSPEAHTFGTPSVLTSLAALERALAADVRFELLGLVGQGGMGRVYKARHRALGRLVALKVVDATPAVLARFAQEARAQARLDHPNACRLYEATTIAGIPCLAMQFIDGETLSELGPRLSWREKVGIVRDVARALGAAHGLGIVHRDVKPGNVLVSTTETGTFHPYVVDFGLAREVQSDGTTQSAASGTPAYMAPEQVRGDLALIGPRTDIWALGATLYELFAGASPFATGEATGVFLRIVEADPTPLRSVAPSAPRDVETIVHKCLAKDPGRRYATAAEVADDLDRVLEGDPISAGLGDRAFRLRARARRSRGALAVLAVAGASALVAAFGLLRLQSSSREEARAASDLGGSAVRLETIARRSALSPLHDTRKDDREMASEMARVRAEIARAPSLAGAGAYALGRAELARRDANAARDWLERAIAAGANDANVEAALGEALSELYRLAIADANHVPASLRKPRLEAAAARYRDPAVTHLRRARELGGESERVLGLIALDESRYDDAVAAARAAFAADPMAFEAKELEGDAEFQRASSEINTGRDAAAEGSYLRAGAAYQAALAIARSDGALYQKEVRRHSFQIVLASKMGWPAAEHYARAMEMSDAAIAAQPDDSVAYCVRAETANFMAHNEENHGRDPAPFFATAEQAARRGLALVDGSRPAPERGQREGDWDLHVRRVLADVLLGIGLWKMPNGVDPTPALEEAIAIYRGVIDAGQGDAWYGNGIGMALRELALYRAEQGIDLDPRPALDVAVRELERAVELNPEWPTVQITLCDVLRQLAEEEERHGIDPSPLLDRAAAAADAALAVEPTMASGKNNRALIDVRRAVVETTRGEDATPLLDAALAGFEEAHRTSPKYALAVQNIGNTALARADDDRVHGRDPARSVRAAAESFARRAEMDPASYWARYQAALAWRLAAYDALAHGRDPSRPVAEAKRLQIEALKRKPNDLNARSLGAELWLLLARGPGAGATASLAHARTEVDEVLARSPHDAEALRVGADIAREAAAGALRRGDGAGGALAAAEEACARADAAIPGSPAVRALRGAVHLLEARAHGATEEGRVAASEAVADFDEAFARDARLVPDFRASRTEAERRAGGGA